MKRTFTIKDLCTGDIIETRAGERGVVIMESNSILYQSGGFDWFNEGIFTDDLFIDGPEREGDIFKIWRDPAGEPLGLNKLFGLDPIFVRRNDKKTRERADEISRKYEKKENEYRTVVILDPDYRQYTKAEIRYEKEGCLDIELSQAPSMTVCGDIKIDRTFIPVPNTENIFLLYNKYQEEWHLKNIEDWPIRLEKSEETEPLVNFKEEGIAVYSRCMFVRKNETGEIENLMEEDLEKIECHLINLEENPRAKHTI